MDFQLDEDRRMLADALGRYLSEQYSTEYRNKAAYGAQGFSAETYAKLAELGAADEQGAGPSRGETGSQPGGAGLKCIRPRRRSQMRLQAAGGQSVGLKRRAARSFASDQPNPGVGFS